MGSKNWSKKPQRDRKFSGALLRRGAWPKSILSSLNAIRRLQLASVLPRPAREDRASLGHEGKQRTAGVFALGRSRAGLRGSVGLPP